MSIEPVRTTAESQIEFLKNVVIRSDVTWYVFARAVNEVAVLPDKSNMMVILLHERYEDTWLIMFHNEDGYFNIEIKHQYEAEEIFHKYSKDLGCQITYMREDLLGPLD